MNKALAITLGKISIGEPMRTEPKPRTIIKKSKAKPRHMVRRKTSHLMDIMELLERSEPRSVTFPAVYLLIHGCRIVYVGQSKNVQVRLHCHRMEDKEFDRYCIVPCEASMLDVLEAEYIQKFSPKYNVQTNGKRLFHTV